MKPSSPTSLRPLQKNISNKVQLIVYAQKIEPYTLYGIQRLLTEYFSDVFYGVHILPFYKTVKGFDEGFDPINHLEVDAELGTWFDIQIISNSRLVVADMIVNHVSSKSSEFQSVIEDGEESPAFPLFLTYDKVFPRGAKESDLVKIYRPRPTFPFTHIQIGKKNTKRIFWTTFSHRQIDIDIYSQAGQDYIKKIITNFKNFGVQIVRLDAVGYVAKKAGTSCFMTEKTKQFITDIQNKLKSSNIKTLIESHTHYRKQIEIAQHCDLVYDFCITPLILFGLYFGEFSPLYTWLTNSPRNCITVLDTHDGIGIVDVARSGREKGLLNNTQIQKLIDTIHKNTEGESLTATGKNATNLDIYQINTTIYSALGCDDRRYLIARLLQFFCPGIPQVYYTGLFALKNDIEQLKRTKVGRDINRPVLSEKDIQSHLLRPVVKQLISLIRFRNAHKSFLGEFSHSLIEEDKGIELTWKNKDQHASLRVYNTQESNNIEFQLSFTESRGSIVTIDTIEELETILT